MLKTDRQWFSRPIGRCNVATGQGSNRARENREGLVLALPVASSRAKYGNRAGSNGQGATGREQRAGSNGQGATGREQQGREQQGNGARRNRKGQGRFALPLRFRADCSSFSARPD